MTARTPTRLVLLGAFAAVFCAVNAAASTSLKLPACSATETAGAQATSQLRPVSAQVRHLDAADLTLSVAPTIDGGVQVEGRGGDLMFRKVVRPDGTFVLELEAPHDKVTVSFHEHEIRVKRGGKTASLNVASGRDDELGKVHRLLADSRAVRLLRVVAAAVQDSEDDSASSAALLIGDAIIGMLTGDAGAPQRVARHLSRHSRVGLRAASLSTATDCYGTWEDRVDDAADEIRNCLGSFGTWSPWRIICAARWTLAVESYWVSFISCSGVNM